MAAPGRRVADAAVSMLVAGAGLLEIWVPLPSMTGNGERLVSTAVVVLFAAALLLRRTHPLAVLLLIGPVFVVGMALGAVHVLFWGGFLPFLVAVFSVARYGRGRIPALGAASAAVLLVVIDLSVDALQSVSEIVFHWLVTSVVWGFGWGLQALEHRAAASTARAIQAEVTAAQKAMAAVVEERTRIARELHDVVAHAVSLMVVQAGAAEQVVEDDPSYARDALRTIRTTGSDVLTEMRRVVSMLRDPDDAGALTPQPGVAALPALVEELRVFGLEVSLTTEGAERALPAGLDLAAYRIVQEALTNVRRHARATRAAVLLRYDDEAVRLQVSDDGQGSSNGSTGHGLVGMRERAALYGGYVETETRVGDGFTVRAVLPVAPGATG